MPGCFPFRRRFNALNDSRGCYYSAGHCSSFAPAKLLELFIASFAAAAATETAASVGPIVVINVVVVVCAFTSNHQIASDGRMSSIFFLSLSLLPLAERRVSRSIVRLGPFPPLSDPTLLPPHS